jgi:FtsP/CotA-like multicopper oxidase with cupredoxin domain
MRVSALSLLLLAVGACSGALSSVISRGSPSLKTFDLDFTWNYGQPDGVKREMIYVNKQFPGPPIIVNQGDDVEVSLSACWLRF